MSILLPSSPLPKSATPKPLDFGGWLTPSGGGATQRLDRLGNRFAMEVATPSLKPQPDSRIWVSRLLQAIGQTVIYAFPQPGLLPAAPGAPVVNAAAQSGMQLLLTGFTPLCPILEGQFFSLLSGGRHYLHMVTADVAADANGAAVLPIWPMLRKIPAVNDPCEFATPVIEGYISGNDKGWTLVIAKTLGLSFTITELE